MLRVCARLVWFVLLLLVVLLGISSMTAGCADPTPTPTKTPRPPATATTPPPTATPLPHNDINPLTGLIVDPALLQRRPIHVRIGNDAEIRPQSGLEKADLVFEDVMEGWWVTRLTAVYLGQDPDKVGPIRSVRLVNLELAPQFDAAMAHSGASDRIRWTISQSTITDLDEYFHPTPYFSVEGKDWRGRLFTSGDRLRKYLSDKGKEKAVSLKGFTFSPQAPAISAGPAMTVTVPYPASSVVSWRYDASAKAYVRFVNGDPHLDANSNQQLSVANVVILYAEHRKTDIVEDSLGNTAIDIVLRGQNRVQLCRDGLVVQGTWKREALEQLFQLFDQDGQPLLFRPGKTWFEIVPTDMAVEIR